MKRCAWVDEKSDIYVKYHDEEWCVPNFDEKYLYEMLILESFQAGLSWECVLNKRENFRKAFDGFDVDKVSAYDENKINDLLSDKGIIRNKRKITASIQLIVFCFFVNMFFLLLSFGQYILYNCQYDNKYSEDNCHC